MLKKVVLISFLVLTLLCCGCKLLSKQTKPVPVRPRHVKTTPRVSKKEVQDRMTKIADNVKKDNWDAANKEVNFLGGDMLNHYPISGKGKSLLKMGKFDADYAKLKVSVKTHKKKDALGDLTKMRKYLKEIT
jgi:hypothetical protein